MKRFTPPLPTVLLTAAGALLYLLHQDLWFWRSRTPLVAGFLPIGLAYHAAYCLLVALLMWALTVWAWPGRLEQGPER
jgi:hypothetical protein